MKIRHSFDKSVIVVAVALFFLIFANFSLYLHSGYAFGGDQSLSVPSINAIKSSFFIWNAQNYAGIVTPLGSLLSYVFSFNVLVYSLFGLKLGWIISTSIIFWLGALGLFILVQTLTKRFGKNLSYFGGILAALVVTLEISSNFKVLSVVGIFIPYAILFLYLITKDLETGSCNKINIFGAILSVSFMLSQGGYGYAIPNVIFLIAISLFLLFTLKRRLWRRYLIYIGFVGVIAVLINFSWIYTTYTSLGNYGSQYFNSYSDAIISSYNNSVINSLLAFGPASGKYALLASSGSFPYVSFLILLIIIAYFIYEFEYSRRARGLEFKVAFSVFLTYLLFTLFLIGYSAPFGILYGKLVSIFRYLLVFRYSYMETHYIVLFSIAALFGISVPNLASKLKYDKMVLALFVAFILILIALYVYAFDYTPIVLSPEQTIPGRIFNISNYINRQGNNFSVSALPNDNGWQSSSWYFGANIYAVLLNETLYDGGYDSGAGFFFPKAYYEYEPLGAFVNTANTINVSLSNGFGIFGIKYIIVQGDTISRSGYASPNFKKIYENLDGAKGLFFIGSFGNDTVYGNSNYVPLIYASNIRYVNGNVSIDQIMNKSLDIQNTSLYYANSSNAAKFSSVAVFSKPLVRFDQNTPVSITVGVYNATTPYYLVFRENYATGWTASYANGTSISSQNHIEVNGFANAWYIDATGTYKINLYYAPQAYGWGAFLVSAAGLGIAFGVGFAGMKELHKRKVGVKNG